MFRWGDVQRHVRGHARGVFLNVEFATALAAAVLPILDAKRLERHHRACHDRCAMAAACHLTRSMFCPERVNDLGALVAVLPTLLQR